jgi:hypothetical protein
MDWLHRRLVEDIDGEFDPDLVWHTVHWCKKYFQPSGQSTLLRFNIGVYQIKQLMEAGKDEERMRSGAAGCALHVLSAAAMLDCLPDDCYGNTRWSDWHEPPCDYENIVRLVATATQMHVYLTTTKVGTVRYGRIDKGVLGTASANLAYNIMAFLPCNQRRQAMVEEMSRLTNFEWKK